LNASAANAHNSVWKVFGNATLKKMVMTENKMFGITLILNIPIIILLIIWSATDTYRRYTVTDDTGEVHYHDPSTPMHALTPAIQHVVCGSDLEIMFFALLLGYLLALLLTSSVLAFITRNYPSAFSESKLIGILLINLSIRLSLTTNN